MTLQQIVRAWKDAEYRRSLTAAERAQLPSNPAGLIELSDAELDQASGAMMPQSRNSCSQYCTNSARCNF